MRVEGGEFGSTVRLWVNVAGRHGTSAKEWEGLPRYRPRASESRTLFRTADLNANGSVDLVWRNRGLGEDSWQWIDFFSQDGKPNLLTRIDNSIGKVTEIEYSPAHDDYISAKRKGAPWLTKIPFPVPTVRQIRTSCGYDLNGDGKEDCYVNRFRYRDGFYDGHEREFRGFSFAQRVDYGDDFIFDPASGQMLVSPFWDAGRTPTRQVPGPTLVTRFRFHTGAADQRDNDLAFGESSVNGFIDEVTAAGGLEEECLKGKQLMEEKLDPWVLHGPDRIDFDVVGAAAGREKDLHAPLTPDDVVYSRITQSWAVRRLYRPAEPLALLADINSDGVLDPIGLRELVPLGRSDSVSVPDGIGKSVSFAFVQRIDTEVIEANGLLQDDLNYERSPPKKTLKEFDFDDYGNRIEEHDYGIMDPSYDDERFTTTHYALGGEALARWMIRFPSTIRVADENGQFVNETRNYYDGEPFAGLSLGLMGKRALLHRVEGFVDESESVEAQRTQYDSFGNAIELRDPNFGTVFGKNGGHYRTFEYDGQYVTYPIREKIAVGAGKPDLVMEAEYDLGFGVVTRSSDFNQNWTDYEYDSFARLVAVVKPGDSETFPTQQFEYQAADSRRVETYHYDRAGELSIVKQDGAANRVVTRNRETAGERGVYTTAVYTDGCGKTLLELGEGEKPGEWVVSKASSYNLRGTEAATWLPYQLQSDGFPRFRTAWPEGRPPKTDGINPEIVSTVHYLDPMGRPIKVLQPPETWGGLRKHTWTQILPFEKRNFDENDSDAESGFADTPLVHFEDGLGRLIKVHEVVRLTDEGLKGTLDAWETRYTYDLNDKLETITDSQDNLKVMDYDGLSRLTFMDDPDRGVMRYNYDPASNLIETTDAKDQTILYTYDGVNRIRSEDYKDEGETFSANHAFDAAREISEGNRPDVAYFYDRSITDLDLGDGARGQGSNPLGQLCYVWDLTGEEHFSYDSRGRMEWQVKRIPDTVFKHILVSWQTKYEYDSLDRVTRLTYPDGDRITYGYNPRNLLENVVGGPSGFILQNTDYRPSAQLSEITYGNGVVTTYNYDPRLRLRDLDTDSPAAGKLIDYAYTFDFASNITRIEDERDLSGQPDAEKRHNTQVFQYDDLYRLT